MLVENIISVIRPACLEVWTKIKDNEERKDAIYEIFRNHKVAENILPKKTMEKLFEKIQKKKLAELEEMRRRQNRDVIDMRYKENPQFKGLETRNLSEIERQIRLLKKTKIIYGPNCNMMNIENTLPVKKNLYDNFDINIPMNLILWEKVEPSFDDKTALKKPKKKIKVEKKIEEDPFRNDVKKDEYNK